MIGALMGLSMAWAQAPVPPPDTVRALERGQGVPIVLTVSGGGSLGAYEAGWLYYMSEAAKANPQAWDVRVLTGTSAGGINTFVMTLSLCGPQEPDPTQSVFFRTWMPIGLDVLLIEDSSTALGILDRAGFDAVLSGLRGTFEGGLRDGCTIDWGVAVARLEPRDIAIAGGYTTPRAQEHLISHVVGRGEGRPPEVTARIKPRVAYSQPVLPVSDPQADVFGLLRDAAFATSAFPVAFSPMELPTCLVGEGEDPTACTMASAVRDPYLDGGLYDNAPIRLGRAIAEADGYADRAGYLYIDSLLGRFPLPPEDEEEVVLDRTLELVSKMGSGLLGVSQTRPLATLMEEDPGVVDRLSVATAYAPQFGREIYSFFALFQQEVREADFWLGVYSAYREIRDRSPVFRLTDLTLPQRADPSWAPFHCLAATYEDADPAPCEEASALRLVPLFQVGAERLYAWCKATPDRTSSGLTSEHCEAARAGAPPPRVPGADDPGDDWALHPGEDPLNHALRRLAFHGFVFTDLDQTEPSEDKSRVAVRHALRDLVQALAGANGGQGLLVSIAGDAMIDSLAPLPKGQKEPKQKKKKKGQAG